MTVAGAELIDEIAELERIRGARPDAELERRILRLRHRLGIARLDAPGRSSGRVHASPLKLAAGPQEVPEVEARDLTAAVARAALMRHGSLVVRGLIGGDQAARLVAGIEASLDGRESGRGEPGLYEEFEPDPPFSLVERAWVSSTGSIWTADSPRLMFDVLGIFRHSGLDRVAAEYLGEPPTVSVNKCVLRRVAPDAGAGWHQDGAFLGDVQALNAWLALSRCGDVAPGIDLVARGLDEIVPTGTEGADFDWSVSRPTAERVAGDAGIARPIFEPGDMLLFDDRCLHATAVSPEMTETRYAAETWFFAPSSFPSDYVPLGV